MSQEARQKQSLKSRPILRGTVGEVMAAYRKFIQTLRLLDEQDKKLMDQAVSKHTDQKKDV